MEINGKGLMEIYFYYSNDLTKLAIAKYCPNLKSLYTLFEDDELETLKVILNSCQQLERIKVMCGNWKRRRGGLDLNDRELLENIAKHSPKTFYELKIIHTYGVKSELDSKELESFFISWTNRIPISFIIIRESEDPNSFVDKKENMKVIEKYIKLCVIKKLKIHKQNYMI